MALTRRALLVPGGRGSARGSHPARARSQTVTIGAPEPIRIDSNENPLGPSPAALEALRAGLAQGHLYPMNARPATAELSAALARRLGASPGEIVLGAGSGGLLEIAVQACCDESRALVTAAPSFGQPVRIARLLGVEVRAVPVDDEGRLDLERMADAARGAGLVFLCNPNNPTGTLHDGDAIARFIDRVHGVSPGTVVHVDEAYHEYVDAPGYRSAVDAARRTPGLFVTRTFSKAYGMAGMRVGYGVGHPSTLQKIGRYSLPLNTSVPGQMAALAALEERGSVERERARNHEARRLTVDFFRAAGHEVFDSQTNFVFVDLGRPAAAFRDACREHGVLVGRDFPPLERSHCRISIGTREQMERAVDVFGRVLEG